MLAVCLSPRRLTSSDKARSHASEPVRISTGSSGLDALLNGGFPKGSLVLLVGPPGSGKSTIARQFLYSVAMEKGAAILLSTSESADTIFASMSSFGWDPAATERIQVVDAYSWRVGAKKGLNLRNLTDVGIETSKIFEGAAPNGSGPALVIDSFTDVLLNNPSEASLSFLATLRTRLQGRFTGLVLLEGGLHTDDVVSTAEYLLDGTIRTKFDDEGRYVMATRMIATPIRPGWQRFTIKKGVELILTDFFGGGQK